MTQSGYLLLGLTAIVGALAGVLAFAVARFFAAARSAGRDAGRAGAETAFMAAAVEEAVGRLRVQEQATKARAEATERVSEQIIASMTSGLLVVDRGGALRTLNPAAQRMLQITSAAIDTPHRGVLTSAPALADVIDESLAGDKPIVRRSIAVDGAEGPLHLGVTVSPIHDEDDEVNGVICLFTDLTGIMDLEEQLRVKDSLARLGELTAGIAHEFRNGLATIHGYGRMIVPERLPDDYRPYVQGIREETEALGQIVTNFLNFARPVQPVLAPVDLRAIADRALDEVRAEVAARGGQTAVAGEFGIVEGDEILLRQAFGNLCRNALDACVGAGVVPDIRVEGAPDLAHGIVRVSVTDNGPGVAPEAAADIFRPFFTTKASGTGLGLALVQKIVVIHNGRISVTAAGGGGARFVTALPLSAAQNC